MIFIAAFSPQTGFADNVRYAPNFEAPPANQLLVAGNACGPASLLSAFRCGSERWQRAANAVPGATDKARMTSIIRTQGMRASPHLGGRSRWSRSGVNVADLTDIANEIAGPQNLPRLRYEVFFLSGKETPEKLIKRVHKRLNRSLAKGLPPVISIRRFAYRETPSGVRSWTIIDGHFVTVIALPKKLGKHDRAFQVTYLDPWGGKKSDGWISISNRSFLRGSTTDSAIAPCLEAVFPKALVGKKNVRQGEVTVLTLSAATGCW